MEQERRMEHCLIYNIDVVVVDGKCTTPCSIEDCSLADMDQENNAEDVSADDR